MSICSSHFKRSSLTHLLLSALANGRAQSSKVLTCSKDPQANKLTCSKEGKCRMTTRVHGKRSIFFGLVQWICDRTSSINIAKLLCRLKLGTGVVKQPLSRTCTKHCRRKCIITNGMYNTYMFPPHSHFPFSGGFPPTPHADETMASLARLLARLASAAVCRNERPRPPA